MSRKCYTYVHYAYSTEKILNLNSVAGAWYGSCQSCGGQGKVVKNLGTIVAWLPMASNQAAHTSRYIRLIYGRMYFVHVYIFLIYIRACTHWVAIAIQPCIPPPCPYAGDTYFATVTRIYVNNELSCHLDLVASHFHSFSFMRVRSRKKANICCVATCIHVKRLSCHRNLLSHISLPSPLA